MQVIPILLPALTNRYYLKVPRFIRPGRMLGRGTPAPGLWARNKTALLENPALFKVAPGEGPSPGVLGLNFGKTRNKVLENRLGNAGRPAPPPRDAPLLPPPPHWLREPVRFPGDLCRQLLGPRLIFWFGTGPKPKFCLSWSRPTKEKRRWRLSRRAGGGRDAAPQQRDPEHALPQALA